MLIYEITDAINAVNLISLIALAVGIEAGRIVGAVIVKLTGDIHRSTVTAKLG